MITDDPGTPGAGKWEINLGWETERASGQTLTSLPLLDANYGIGDRTELTYEAPWVIVHDEEGTRSGLGDSLLGVKYRFYDAGEKGWQASVYPQYTFVTPGSHADRRGIADSGSSLLLPLEVEKDLELFSINFDGGHLFSSEKGEDEWMGGVVVGREVSKGWELDVETHVEAANRLNRSEWIVNGGTRIDLSEKLTLMIALGRDLSNSMAPKTTLISYLGVQVRL